LISLLVVSISRAGHAQVVSKRTLLWLFTLGFVATLTRVEFLLLMGVAGLTLFLSRWESGPSSGLLSRLRLAITSAAPLLGSVLAASVIYLSMHTLIPDTAIAKSNVYVPWQAIVRQAVDVFVSAMSFGVILIVLWLLTVAAVIVYKRRLTLSILVANSLFPLVLALAGHRGQEVQGVRYFVWTLVFPILWNILELRWIAAEPQPSGVRFLKYASNGVVGLLLIVLPVESYLLSREFHQREKSLAQFRGQHLERLAGLKLVAFDIGYIGYFTGSPLCDMAGLVNGRASAALSFPERVKACAMTRPQYAFLSTNSLWELHIDLNLKGWSVCSEYDLSNLRSPDLHYLIASPAAAAQVCAAAGSAPRPLESLYHWSADTWPNQ
jgi:hypothetical protein